MTRVSAPGKMVLLGEYAVLFGAPAVVAAVNRRAVVELSPSPSRWWELTAPGLTDRPVEFEIDDHGAPCWRGDEDRRRFSLVDRLLVGLSQSHRGALSSSQPLAAILDTRAFFESTSNGRLKLGLGSSAALTVALTSALSARMEDGDRVSEDSVGLQQLIDLHREIQGGLGSGVDVAASLHGGVTCFQLEETGSARVTPLVLPPDLHLQAFWTGSSASTGAFLDRLHRQREERPKEIDAALGKLGAVSRDGVAALTTEDTPRFLAAVDQVWDALTDLGRAIDMPIVSGPHEELRQMARAHGVHYKPSGAGGGDLGIGFAAAPGPLKRLSAAVGEAGFDVIDLGVDARGVTREEP